MTGIISLEDLEKYDSFVADLEELLNKHKVSITCDREGNLELETITDGNYITLYQTIYRDSYHPSKIYYELQKEIF